MTLFDSYHDETNTNQFSGETLVLHSEYFNVTFQKALEDLGDKLDLKLLLTITAQEVVFSQFNKYFSERPKLSFADKKHVVEEYFAHCGFGTLSLKSISNKGGHADLQKDFYADAWKAHFGDRKANEKGVGYFVCGYLCGAIEAIFGVNLGTFDGKQTQCQSKGDEISRFDIYRGLRKKLNKSPGYGLQQDVDDSNRKATNISDQKVVDPMKELRLTGFANDEGYINQFDTRWTRHYANYYSIIIIKLLMMGEKKLGKGGFSKIKSLLQHTGETNAYFVIGKVLNSDYWNNNIAPSLATDATSKIQSILDVMTGFGFGRWQLIDETPESLSFSVKNNPETNAFLKLVGNTKAALGFFTGGFLTGLVNYVTHEPKSKSINRAFIENLMAEKGPMTYQETQSRMLGSEHEQFKINIH